MLSTNRQQSIILAAVVGVAVISILLPEQAHASAAGGAGLPWEQPLQTITRSIQGPVAYGISLLALIACGAMLVWGGEINEFMRRGIMLTLVISMIIFATNLMSGLFSTAAGL